MLSWKSLLLGVQIDSEEPSSSSIDSDSDNLIDCMTADDSKSIWKKWLQEQPKDSLKMLSVMVTDTFTERFGLMKTNAAEESALLLGMNKTIRTWRKNYYANMGKFSDSKQGRHSRPYIILDDDKLRHAAFEAIHQKKERPT